MDLNGYDLLNADLHKLAQDPQNAEPGRIYYNTTEKCVRFYDGTAWKTLAETDLGTNPNLNEVQDTGFYTYTANNGITYNLLVQTYNSDQWCVQYSFTANNITRRYYDYTRETWSPWSSISVDQYNPNEDFIANSRTIRNGLKDTNKNGLFIGDYINNRFMGLSNVSLAEMYQTYLDDKLEGFERSVSSYDLKKPSGDPQWDTSVSGLVSVGNSSRGISLNLDQGGYNTSYGFYIRKESFITVSTYSSVILNVNSYYSEQTLTIRTNTTEISLYIPYQTQMKIKITINDGSSAILIPGHYLYISDITFLPIVNIIPGNAVSLIEAIKYSADYEEITIPEGTYNVGLLDEVYLI